MASRRVFHVFQPARQQKPCSYYAKYSKISAARSVDIFYSANLTCLENFVFVTRRLQSPDFFSLDVRPHFEKINESILGWIVNHTDEVLWEAIQKLLQKVIQIRWQNMVKVTQVNDCCLVLLNGSFKSFVLQIGKPRIFLQHLDVGVLSLFVTVSSVVFT